MKVLQYLLNFNSSNQTPLCSSKYLLLNIKITNELKYQTTFKIGQNTSLLFQSSFLDGSADMAVGPYGHMSGGLIIFYIKNS
jgi:hypothetical protein